ncbi:MAG: Gfo/Idh/MocA family protein [bacterium]
MKIKVGQIGLGHLGARHCAALAEIPEAELVGVFDIDIKKRHQIARSFNVRALTNLEQFFGQVQALIVAVPTRQHFEIAHLALSNDINVFVEKPISATVEEAEQLVQLAHQKKLILQVGHIERFNPAVQALANEKLHPLFIESHRLAAFNARGTDVAVVLDLMIHDLDLILNFVPHDICQIDASGVAVITPEIDMANARIQFENGCVANVTASRIAERKLRTMRLFQEDTYICIDFIKRIAEKFKLVPDFTQEKNHRPTFDFEPVGKKNVQHKKIFLEKLQGDNHDPLKMELEAFLKSVRSREKPLVDGVAGKRVLELATEIIKIIETQVKV